MAMTQIAVPAPSALLTIAQCFRHADACMTYAREALAEGDVRAAEKHVNAAQAWNDAARARRA